MVPANNELLVELSGPGIEPGTVDSVRLLRLSLALVGLVDRLAGDGLLTFVGLGVVNKCAAVSVKVNEPAVARAATERAIRLVRGDEDAPYGTETVTDDLRNVLASLPSGHSAKVLVGQWQATLEIPTDFLPRQLPWERTEQRVHVVRVGGKRPVVRLSSESETDDFSLDATEEVAQKFGLVLYRDADVEMEILRDPSGRIERGRVLDVHALDDDDDSAWRAWFRENASESSELNDAGGELGRRSD